MPVLAVVILGASEFHVGVLTASATAAFLLIGLPAGAWVDRWLKRRVMIAADLVRAAAMLSVPLLWWMDLLQIWHLYAVAGVLGPATVFFDVAYRSYVPVLPRRSTGPTGAPPPPPPSRPGPFSRRRRCCSPRCGPCANCRTATRADGPPAERAAAVRAEPASPPSPQTTERRRPRAAPS